MKPRSLHRLVSLACVALTVTVLTGCGAVLATDADEAAGPVGSRSARPTKTPAEDTAAEQPSRSAGTRATLPTRLLAAEELLSGVGSGAGWEETRTTRREPRSLAGTCHRFGLLSIGAMHVAHRDYTPVDGSNSARANELVASFADAKTARRAFEVLTSWRDDCDARLDRWKRHVVGPLRTVRTGAGETHSYLLTYGPVEGAAGFSHYDAEGLVLVGNRIAVLRIDLVGRDTPYADDLEPVTTTIRAAADKLR